MWSPQKRDIQAWRVPLNQEVPVVCERGEPRWLCRRSLNAHTVQFGLQAESKHTG